MPENSKENLWDKNRSLRHFDAYKQIDFWKFNSSLLEDEDYIKLVTDRYNICLEERIGYPRSEGPLGLHVVQMRYETIPYSNQKAKNRREKLSVLEQKIKKYTAKCDKQPNQENVSELEIL